MEFVLVRIEKAMVIVIENQSNMQYPSCRRNCLELERHRHGQILKTTFSSSKI